MQKRGIVFVIGGLIALSLVGGLYLYFNPITPALSYTLIETGERQHREEAEYYTVQINYPDKTPLETRGTWGAESRAQATIVSTLTQLIDQFKQAGDVNGLSDDEKARLNQSGLKYSLSVINKPYSSGSFVSYEFDIYMDTGGAHPNNLYKTLVFDLSGNEMALGDLFVSGSNYLERISEMARTQIIAQLESHAGEKGIEDAILADGIAPRASNFENFVVDSDRIRIFIPPYQAAAYAAGSFEIQVPLIEVKDILKPDVK